MMHGPINIITPGLLVMTNLILKNSVLMLLIKCDIKRTPKQWAIWNITAVK